MNVPVGRRPYRMVARAASAAATADRILDATVAAFWEDPARDASLDEIAARAGVTVQTVIRRFGNRQALLAAAGEREAARIAAQRDPAAVADTAGAARQLVAHYEEMGDRVMRLLAEEHRLPGLRAIADRGRTAHRSWCEQVFARTLARLAGHDRRLRLAQLVAACDVYTWKLLRRDAGLSRSETERALLGIIQPLVEGD